MSRTYKSLRGTRDILPEEATRWQQVERVAREIFRRYGFGEIRTPILEPTELFARSVGETSDIVRKEMYTFDRGSDSLTLRPENTASVARAFIQHSLARDVASGYPVRLYYIGPMFRSERPQAGRQRQFHQLGAEVLGSEAPAVDAETICMLDRFLDEVGVKSRKLLINSLGDAGERRAYRESLGAWLEEPVRKLGDPEIERTRQENPLRLLDSKDPRLQQITGDAPSLSSSLGSASRENFDRVLELLEAVNVKFEVDPRLVRGLDYYERTVFEIVSDDLGAQNALVGGGRYDGLIESLGGPSVPGFGFAMGLERLLMLMPQGDEGKFPIDIAMILLGGNLLAAQQLGEQLRSSGLSVSVPLADRPLGAQLKRATKMKARFAMFVGEDEIAAGEFGLKDLLAGTQIDASIAQIKSRVAETRKEETRR